MASENLIFALKKKDITINKLRADIQKLKSRQLHHDEQARKEHQRQIDDNKSLVETNEELRQKVYELEQQIDIPEALRAYSPDDIEDLKNGYEFFKELETFFGNRFDEMY